MRRAKVSTFAAFQEWCRSLQMAVASGRSKRLTERLAERKTLLQELYARTEEGVPPAAHPELGPCWLWTGARTKRGYGTICVGGKTEYAHRVLYGLLIGKMGEGLETDHKCRVRHCINPRHLEAVTSAENMRRVAEARTHCKRGHAFTDDNLTGFEKGLGRRQCRMCTNERSKRRARRATAGAAGNCGRGDADGCGRGDCTLRVRPYSRSKPL